MAYNTKKMLRDADNKLIPQFYDPVSDAYKPINDPTRVQLSGSIEQFATGAVTITATAKELKSGASTLSGRKQLIVYPPTAGKIYWGISSVTVANGAPLSAGELPMEFTISDTVKVYAVSDGTDREVRVVESK